MIRQTKIILQNPKDPHFVADPYDFYSQLHAQGSPVYWKNYGFWCLSNYQSVDCVLRDRRFARIPPAGFEKPALPRHMQDFASTERYSLLALEPPHHTRLRKSVNRAFVSRHVNRMSTAICQLAHRCIDRFEHDGSVDLLPHYATPIPVEVITHLLGVPAVAGKQLVEWSHAMIRVYTLKQTGDEEHAANNAAARFIDFIKQLIIEKRKTPDNGLISHLLASESGGQRLSDEEIISVTILLLNAGHEATVHQLGNAVNTLLTHYPAERRQKLIGLLKADQTADQVVAECLRFDAPLHLFTRYAQEDIDLHHDVNLRKGEQVGLLLAAANRCPIRFSDPNHFNPDRTDAGNLSLGAGIHFCVGAQLAKLELRIALQVLFERLPNIQLTRSPRYQNSYHFHGLAELHVHW